MRAAEAALRISSFAAIADTLVQAAKDRSGWPAFHAAIAVGLTGDTTMARHFFSRLTSGPVHHDGQAALGQEAGHLASFLGDRAAYRGAIQDRISACRALRKLQSDPACLDDVISHQTQPQHKDHNQNFSRQLRTIIEEFLDTVEKLSIAARLIS
jgi:hypothetical protein